MSPVSVPMEKTAATLLALRREMRATQRKMGGIFGVTLRTYGAWERGAAMPTPSRKLLEQAIAIFRTEGAP